MSDTYKPDALKIKRELIAASPAAKSWRAPTFLMNFQEAVNFLNPDPPQGPGEGIFVWMPDAVSPDDRKIQVAFYA